MKNAEYELGRYKKKVVDQKKEIMELEAAIEGYCQLLQVNNSLLAAVVKSCGEVTIMQEDINKALQEELGVMTKYDEVSCTYTLRTVVNTNGEGTG